MDYGTLAPRGVRWIKNNWNNFDFDMAVQRKANLWSLKKKTMLIYTAIANYPTNPIFVEEIKTETENGTVKRYGFYEGKQRMMTMNQYINDEFALTDDILDVPHKKGSDIVLNDLVGRKYSELDKQYQDAILDFRFQYINLSDATEEELEFVMFYLNDGEPMSAMEKTRVKAGRKVIEYLEEIAKCNFIINKLNLSSTDRQRFIDQELILQIMSLVMEYGKSFSTGDIRNFAVTLKDGVSDEVTNTLIETFEYLDKAFPSDDRMLKKLHVPSIFKIGMQMIEEKVEPEIYGKIVTDFLNEQSKLLKEHKKDDTISIGDYNEACSGGTAKKEKVNKRIDTLGFYVFNAVADIEEEKEKLETLNGQSEDSNVVELHSIAS